MEASTTAVPSDPVHPARATQHVRPAKAPSRSRFEALRLAPAGLAPPHLNTALATPAAFWEELLLGAWRIFETLETTRWRYLIALQRSPAKPLTERERLVLDAVVDGQLDKVVAYDMGLSVSTVATHRAQAVQKLGLGSHLLTIQLGRAVRAGAGCSCAQVTVFSQPGPGRPRRIVRVPCLANRLPAALTPAEGQVLTSLLAGKSNRTIAAERNVSQRTVANQIASAFHRLGVSRRRELVAKLCECHCGVGAVDST